MEVVPLVTGGDTDWERGERPMSKEHDYELRGIALASLLKRITGAEREALAQDADHILSAPRRLAPLKRPKRYIISAALAA